MLGIQISFRSSYRQYKTQINSGLDTRVVIVPCEKTSDQEFKARLTVPQIRKASPSFLLQP